MVLRPLVSWPLLVHWLLMEILLRPLGPHDSHHHLQVSDLAEPYLIR